MASRISGVFMKKTKSAQVTNPELGFTVFFIAHTFTTFFPGHNSEDSSMTPDT